MKPSGDVLRSRTLKAYLQGEGWPIRLERLRPTVDKLGVG
jgi:hypothetical protein